MQKLYEHKYLFPVNDNKGLTAMEAYEFLKAEINLVMQNIQSNAIIGTDATWEPRKLGALYII